ncbi:hypothetical protein HKCCE2091_18110 [Rhodobacterales bacterium HKCCE2091]|nr:hypothetical protein [Rhodobacterales bacterium HKCCE2091]
MLGLDHPFFRPLWIRIAVVAVCFGWAAVELSGGNPGWAMIFAAFGAVAVWNFFVVRKDPGGDDGTGEDGE